MRRSVRLGFFLVLMGILSAVLPACSGINRPFARDKSWLGTRDPQAPPVTVTKVDGIPPASADRLAGQLYTESRRRGFSTTMHGDNQNGFVVTGSMSAAPTGDGTTVVYVFDVWDPSRRHQHRITGEENIPGGAFGDPWNAVDDSAMQRIASTTAEELGGFISRMGYEIRMASVPPPAGMLSDAADSITTASATGSLYLPPSALGAHEDPPPVGTAVSDQTVSAYAETPRRGDPAAAAVSAPAPAQPEQRTAAVPEAGQPSAIAVPLVVGASAQGNRELAQAMRAAMGRAGLPVVEERREGALTIVGEVDLDQAQGDQQTVALNWRVLDPQGKLIGTIAQNNQVPAGSLDRGWGDNATYAAEAAAGGIFELLSRPR